ncbi:rifin [Plasmodium falciparum RAJ116]|uniref:Rifin n=1 Tax=Plasmodium falciparum RAJ116 TaxID=580058 RepID=A0A0L0CZ28_PLAFA|nr:rifin [Plasmodium falciparum RAJ116]
MRKRYTKNYLKDKVEKELTGKLSTLQTDIQSDAIPTCVCEKSLADKVEKGCLKCAGVLGGGITPGWGLISGIVYTGWKAAALAAAKELAEKAGAAAGEAARIKAGIEAVMNVLVSDFGLSTIDDKALGLVINATSYTDVPMISKAVYAKFKVSCMPRVGGTGAITRSGAVRGASDPICSTFNKLGFVQGTNSYTGDSMQEFIKEHVASIVSQAENTAKTVGKRAINETTAELTAQKTGMVQTTYMGYQTVIIASIVAILVIVLVMIIIYLILRYRRKKKMKKKLQYIKLLEE